MKTFEENWNEYNDYEIPKIIWKKIITNVFHHLKDLKWFENDNLMRNDFMHKFML